MIRSVLAFLFLITALGIQLASLQSCATPTAPTGGDRDTLGPVLVLEETTPNFQTNFKPEEIVLTFDEWVEIDTKQPILISPPLDLGEENIPRLRRRSLVIPLTGLELRDSVTYVVNIDAAIKDLNEGNPTENLRFVFATGPVLDSASVSGRLVTDFSGEPIDNATFTLFGNLADTAITTENPTYFAQTDEDGRFTVNNVRPGTYRAVALERNPSATNYFFDLEGFAQPLAAGFVDTLVVVEDGKNSVGTIKLSPILKPVRANDVDTTIAGVVRLTMNQPAESIDATFSGDYLRVNEADTLALFYRQLEPDTIFVGRNGEVADTVALTGRSGTQARNYVMRAESGRKIYGPKGLRLRFDRPLESLDTSLVDLTVDTFPERRTLNYGIDTTDARLLTINGVGQENSRYQLILYPGALTDWSGQTNKDTLEQKWTVGSPDKFGTLNLSFINLDSTQQYLIRLLKDDDPVERSGREIMENTRFSITYAGLEPGTYFIELTLDDNRNGRYDAGDLLLGLQPEYLRNIPLEPLRANWEVEQEIDVEAITADVR